MFNDDVYEDLQKPTPPCIPLLCWGRVGYFANFSKHEEEKANYLGADELQQCSQKRSPSSDFSIRHSMEKSTVPKSVDVLSNCENKCSPDSYTIHQSASSKKNNYTWETRKEKNSPKQTTLSSGCVNTNKQSKNSLSNECLNSYSDARPLEIRSNNNPYSEVASTQCRGNPNHSMRHTDSHNLSICRNKNSPNSYANSYTIPQSASPKKTSYTMEARNEQKNSAKQRTLSSGRGNIKEQSKRSLSNECLNSYSDSKPLENRSTDISDSEVTSTLCKRNPNHSVRDTDSHNNFLYSNEVSFPVSDSLQEFPEHPETNSHQLVDVESCQKVQPFSLDVSLHVNQETVPKHEQWLVVENVPEDVDLSYVEDYFKSFGELKQFVFSSDNEGGIRLMIDIDCEEDWFIGCLNGSFAFGEFTRELNVYRVTK